MIKKILTIVLLLNLFSTNCFSQAKATSEVIDSLRIKYCYDRKYLRSILIKAANESEDTIPPPPPLTDKDAKSFYADHSCKKRFKIPKEELLKLYPFNVDSVVVFIPDDCYWQKGGVERIGKMTTKQIAQFAHILYDYGFKKIDGIYISRIDIVGCALPVPDVRLCFYDNTEVEYLDIFSKGFVDSFAKDDPYKDYGSEDVIYENNTGIYWGGECDETYTKIIKFVKKNFKHELKISRYECDAACSSYDIIELKEGL